jgi:hypothetical protein
MSAALLLTSAGFTLAFAPAPFPKAEGRDATSRHELIKMQGTWEGTGSTVGKGWWQPDTMRVVVRGRRMTVMQNGKVIGEWRVAIDVRHSKRKMRLVSGSGGGERLETEYWLRDDGMLWFGYVYEETFKGEVLRSGGSKPQHRLLDLKRAG